MLEATTFATLLTALIMCLTIAVLCYKKQQNLKHQLKRQRELDEYDRKRKAETYQKSIQSVQAVESFLNGFNNKPIAKRTIKESVHENDIIIMDLATYWETKGLTRKATPEEIQIRFQEFKKRILAGSFTISELEEDVVKKWGIE